MRIGQMFGRTLRNAPAEAEMISHQLALRAGLARALEGGRLAYLPLGWRAMERLKDLWKGALADLGGQELRLPAGDAEEQAWAIAELARREVESYRQLPRLLLHFPARPRPNPRPGAGLLGLREALLAEAFSLHLEPEALQDEYGRVSWALAGIFDRLGLAALTVEAAPAAAARQASAHAFVLVHPQGRDRLLACEQCGYAATEEAAVARPEAGAPGAEAALEKVYTPDCHTIADLAQFLGIAEKQTLKAVFYVRDEAEFVFAVIRGDLDVNEAKLRGALGGGTLRPASDAEIEAVGAAPGYASPAGLKVRPRREPGRPAAEGVTVAADPSVELGSNFAGGANEAGYHFVNVNYPRDFSATLVADIAQARAGQACGRCGAALEQEPAILLGQCEQLGARYALDEAGQPRVTALDPGGRPQPLLIARYTVDLDRLLAAVLETHHDEAGIRWPRAAAPFDVHLVSLLKSGDRAERLAAELEAAGHAVLCDDRAEAAGVKFADADLLGSPVRLTVSERSLKAGGVELKRREASEREIVALDEIAQRLAPGGASAA